MVYCLLDDDPDFSNDLFSVSRSVCALSNQSIIYEVLSAIQHLPAARLSISCYDRRRDTPNDSSINSSLT
jgi:hypothetical protein